MKQCLILVAVLLAAGCGREFPSETAESAVSEEQPPAVAAPEVQKQMDSMIAKAEEEAQKKRGVIIVEEAVKGFKILNDEKRYPRDLGELLQEGMLASLPELPAGSRFIYDSATGKVTVASEAVEDGIDAAPEANEDSGEPAPADPNG